MHIITGVSALQVIRCLRSQGAETAREWFPEVEEPVPVIQIPQLGTGPRLEIHEQPLLPAHTFDETLDDVSFPFEKTVSNKKLDCTYIDGCERLDFRKHLELGVFDLSRRAYRKSLRTRILRRDLPSNSLIWAGRHTAFASPELVIVQLASRLSEVRLAQIIMELTGYYSLPPETKQGERTLNNPSSRTTYGLEPVTTIARIRSFACHVRMARNQHILNAALEIALDRAASPIESAAAIVLRRPIELGGYSMRKLLLNPKVEVPEYVSKFVSQKAYYPDMYFPDCATDLEYESTEFHLDPITANWSSYDIAQWRTHQAHKAASDRKRAREIEALGIRVIPIIWEDLLSSDQLDRIAWLLARRKEEFSEFDADTYMAQLDFYEYHMAREQLLEELSESY